MRKIDDKSKMKKILKKFKKFCSYKETEALAVANVLMTIAELDLVDTFNEEQMKLYNKFVEKREKMYQCRNAVYVLKRPFRNKLRGASLHKKKR